MFGIILQKKNAKTIIFQTKGLFMKMLEVVEVVRFLEKRVLWKCCPGKLSYEKNQLDQKKGCYNF